MFRLLLLLLLLLAAAADAADCLEGSLRCYFQIVVASKFGFLALVLLVKKHRTACCFYHD